MSANTCGTCTFYSGEHCAINRSTPMQYKLCPPTWACPAWEAVECEQGDGYREPFAEHERAQRIIEGVR